MDDDPSAGGPDPIRGGRSREWAPAASRQGGSRSQSRAAWMWLSAAPLPQAITAASRRALSLSAR